MPKKASASKKTVVKKISQPLSKKKSVPVKKTQKPVVKKVVSAKVSKPVAKKNSVSKIVLAKKTPVVKKIVEAKKTPAKKVVVTKTSQPVTKSSQMTKNFSRNYEEVKKIVERKFLAASRKFAHFPDLLLTQKKGFSEFVEYYLPKLFDDVNPIQDIAGEKMQLTIGEISVSEPINTIDQCKRNELTYGGIITGKIKLMDSVSNKVLFNKIVNIGILPLMTKWGSYIINGIEKVVISQIIKSFGIFYNYDRKDHIYSFKLIPERGPWLEVLLEKSNNIYARVNRSRKFPITSLLRVFGFETDQNILEIFKDCFEEGDINFIKQTLEKDTTTDSLSAAVFIYNKIRPGEVIDPESALDYLKSQFLSIAKIFLGRIARRKINAKLGLTKDPKIESSQLFDSQDMVEAIKYLLNIANNKRNFYLDDIDHLSNRRVRTTGEILYSHVQPVMRKFVKSVKGKLSILNLEEQIKLNDLVNFKIIDNSIKTFFATSQLCQFLDQTNPLSEIEHKRRLTALGPGGLKKETAKFEVRDLHFSHYGRICPIETPEGPNIGLVVHQGLFSKVNEDGFLETQAVRVQRHVQAQKDLLLNRIVDEDIYEGGLGTKKGKVVIKKDQYITAEIAKKLQDLFGKSGSTIKVRPFVTTEVEFISPEMDERCTIADISTHIDDYKNIIPLRVPARHMTEMQMFHINDITHVDVNPSQVFSLNTSLIPFVNHDEAVRASVATNQQRQAVPLLYNDAPLVGTGLERDIAAMTYALIEAEDDGEVLYVDASKIRVKYKTLGMREYELTIFKKSNHKTVIHQRPKVSLGERVEKGSILAEGSSVVDGEMALGKNIRVAFMSWEGYNFEDAIIISQRLIKDDDLTSVHIEEYEIEVSDTKLGPEEITSDIPGVPLSKLKNLDDDGIIRIGATVKGGDILVGKITPKSEGELSPEEKLIQAIFGDKSKNYKDNSLYLPAGSEGKVVDMVVLDSKKGDNLMAGVRKKIKVYVAMTRKIEVGDKLAGRHGNKGIISIVVPQEDMPYTEDGQSIDILLNPLGVISRMNVGQAFEVQLGLIAKALGTKFAVPLFSGFGSDGIKKLLQDNNLPLDGKMSVYDGRSGEKFPNKVSVGYMHMLKLSHMVEDKIHARSVGPYSLITQQPLGGKARDGGQRFGEMEVRALEGYSAVYTLQEMLTIKSDDILGRNKTYESIIKGERVKISGIPESFNLVTYLLKGLCQNIIPLSREEMEVIHQERVRKIMNLGLKGLTSSDSIADIVQSDDEDLSSEEKKEMMETVIEEMKDFGDLNE